jgi:hypothetical protein
MEKQAQYSTGRLCRFKENGYTMIGITRKGMQYAKDRGIFS